MPPVVDLFLILCRHSVFLDLCRLTGRTTLSFILPSLLFLFADIADMNFTISPSVLLLVFLCLLSTSVQALPQQGAEWGRCSNNAGVCYDTSEYSCSYAPLSGKCLNGGADILCCPLPGGVIAREAGCLDKGGTCKREEDCFFGHVEAGLCPGPNPVKCCIEDTCCDGGGRKGSGKSSKSSKYKSN